MFVCAGKRLWSQRRPAGGPGARVETPGRHDTQRDHGGLTGQQRDERVQCREHGPRSGVSRLFAGAGATVVVALEPGT